MIHPSAGSRQHARSAPSHTSTRRRTTSSTHHKCLRNHKFKHHASANCRPNRRLDDLQRKRCRCIIWAGSTRNRQPLGSDALACQIHISTAADSVQPQTISQCTAHHLRAFPRNNSTTGSRLTQHHRFRRHRVPRGHTHSNPSHRLAALQQPLCLLSAEVLAKFFPHLP